MILSVLALIMIPAMVAAGGSDAWSLIALGQGVGAIVMAFIGWGWWITGPARIARASAIDRVLEYNASAIARPILFLLAVAPTLGVSYLIAPHDPLAVFLGAILSASVGLSASWYFAGIQRPYMLLAMETMPRALGTGIAIAYLLLGGNIYMGVVIQILGIVAAFVTTTVWVMTTSPTRRGLSVANPRARVLGVLWERRLGLTVSILAVTYRAMPIVLVGWFAPGALPPFALMDKISLQINTGIQPLISAIQGWVPHLAADRRKLRTAFAALIGLSLLGGVAFYLISPALTLALGAGEITPDSALIVTFSAFIALAFFDSALFKAFLPALEKVRAASAASVASLMIGVPSTLVGVIFWGPVGAMVGVLAGLATKITIEIVAVLRA
ncbi:hypothetical protein [Microbacterium aurantiacum]|uniref:Membrane protein involved in the export of O-antigen and teichoic acid n=1 Tax=Microbacterium aurantiacum TaxID=162393 RepID=A0ABT8FV02_9MICO|nr:hypothetical protein [Microbacterium aurantiacum]MDN4465136.1 hypothetical protein [Microbacterium aurantiacum]